MGDSRQKYKNEIVAAGVKVWRDAVSVAKDSRKLLCLLYVINEVFSGLKQGWDMSKSESFALTKEGLMAAVKDLLPGMMVRMT